MIPIRVIVWMVQWDLASAAFYIFDGEAFSSFGIDIDSGGGRGRITSQKLRAVPSGSRRAQCVGVVHNTDRTPKKIFARLVLRTTCTHVSHH
jgi:hypothetical protein